MQGDAARRARQRILWLAAVGIDIDPREPLAGELIGHDVAGRVERHAGLVDRCRPLGGPAGSLFAHVLEPHRLAYALRQHGSIHGAVVGILAAFAAWDRPPLSLHLLPPPLTPAPDRVRH